VNDQWTSKLSDYLDGELPAAERQALEAHLATCAACGRTLDELRRVVARAAALEDRPPTLDLWSGVARRIGVSVTPAVVDLTERRRRRFAFTLPQLAAAAVVLISVSGAGVWLAMDSRAPSAVSLPAAGSPTARHIGWFDSTQAYDASVAELQQALEQGRTRLDTTTVRVLEENLRIIDRAIAQARTALAADPGSTYLSLHLAQTMRTKLELLRRAQAIAARS
jgi:anti-sigma factor RsiW